MPPWLVGHCKAFQKDHGEEDGYVYAEGVRRGGTLVSAREWLTQTVPDTEAILDQSAVNIRDRGTAWRKAGWQNFDPKAKPYTADEIRKLYRTSSDNQS